MIVTDFVSQDPKWKDKPGFYMDGYLASNIIGIDKYLAKDWDAVGIFSGHGQVRIGKTQKKGNKILMSNGFWKNIEDVKVGDELISPQEDGTISYEQITELHNRFEEDCYDVIEESTGKVLYSCAGNHDIPLFKLDYKKGKYESKILEAKTIATSSFNNKNQYYCLSSPCLEFKHNNPTIDAYSLGVWLGDGSFTEQLTLTTKEQIIIDHISELYEIKKVYDKKETIAKQYRFSNNGRLGEELINLGLRYKRSGDKFIPQDCLLADSSFRWNLLAGLIDTDGYCNKQNSIIYTTKSKRLAEDIKELVFSLGGYSSIKKTKKSIKRINFVGDYFNVRISFNDNSKIPLKVKHKIDRISKSSFNRNHIYIKIIKSSPSEVYGFSITGKSKFYVTDNWMITHNSTIAFQVATFVAWLLAGGKMKFEKVRDINGKEHWVMHEMKPPKKPMHWSLQENVVFSARKLKKRASELYKKYGKNQVIIYDEGRQGVSASRAMENLNKEMEDFFQECGFMGHVIFIVLPNFFKLHEDYAVSRSLFLLDAFRDKNKHRGYFNFYDERQKEWLYFLGKKKLGITQKYTAAHESFWGRFSTWFPFDRVEYERLKIEGMKEKERSRLEQRWKKQRDAMAYILNEKFGLTAEEIAVMIKDWSGEEINSHALGKVIAFIRSKAQRL